MPFKRTLPFNEEGDLELRGKKVLVLGLGRSGLSAARFLAKKKAKVFASDDKGVGSFKKQLPSSVRFVKPEARLLAQGLSLIVVSPGVPWDKPLLKKARKKGVLVLPEFELGWRFLRPRFTIAVTGTNGKSTTTALLGWILNKSGKKAVVAGNIGVPLTSLKKRSAPIMVLELSSYQIEAQNQFRPNVGIWLNLTSDHLARHKTMAAYAGIKASLFSNSLPSDLAVLNRKDKWCRKFSGRIHCRKTWFPSPRLKKISRSLSIPGEHNQENAMAAVQAALAAGAATAKIRKALKTFKGVPHRLEPCGSRKGVVFINDSKATNVESTLTALKAAPRRTHLILGGEHKGSPYSPLAPLIKKKVVQVYAIGKAQRIVQKDLRKAAPVLICQNLKNAVKRAFLTAQKGDTVLLSPACASFDQFKNFEERGDAFKRLVRKI